MARKPETIFREKVIDDLRTVPRCVHFSIQQASIVGTPDLFLCVNGVFVVLELKASDISKISKMQLYNISQVERVGGKGFVAYPQNWKSILMKLQMIGIGEELKEGFIK